MSKPKRYHLEMQKGDDGDWVLYEDYARLKAEVERLERQNETYNDVTADVITERDRLKAVVERLTAFTSRTILPTEELLAQVERLTKAGDAMADECSNFQGAWPLIKDWNAAKEGKKP